MVTNTSNALAPSESHVQVLRESAHVRAVLSPLRRRILECLQEPDSATGVASRLGTTRQKINYHLRELEKHGLLELVSTQRKRGCTERTLRTSAKAFVLESGLLGGLAADPDALRDRFSSAYLIAVAARTVHDVATLRERAAHARRKLATFTLEADFAFESPEEYGRFVHELGEALAALALRYHKPSATTGSRRYRVVLASHPMITKDASSERAPTGGES